MILDNSNDPELSGKYLGKISEDFVKVADALKEASYQIRTRAFSEFPIFPISQHDISVGALLIDPSQYGTEWTYRASYLDEFIQRDLVDNAKVDAFKSAYKNPDEFCCLFVIDSSQARFVYIPYPID